MTAPLPVDRIIRPGCFKGEDSAPKEAVCWLAERCKLAPDCIWAKTDIELREDPLRGADAASISNVLQSR